MEIKHNSVRTPELSGTSAQILAALRAKKLRRTPYSIIRARRAAQTQAASHMKAKVSLGRLEARLASDILDHCRKNEVTPSDGASDFELTGDQAATVLDLVHEMDIAQDQPDGDGRMPQRRQGVAL